MSPTLTNLGLMGLTGVSAAASVVAVIRLRATMLRATGGQEGTQERPSKRALNVLVAVVAVGSAGLLAQRWWASGSGWNPLRAHVDGLLLIASMLAAVGLYVHRRPRLGGLSAFYLPLLTVILAWAVCASAWTYRPFNMETLHPVWRGVHLMGVYVGTLGCTVAAVAGVMYLVVARRLKLKRNPGGLMRLASLEALEQVIVQASTLGFALLTVGLVSGVVVLVEEGERLGPGWWTSPKVVLAFAAWGLYAVVMNVRVATVFRGRRAAWLAITGLVLLWGVYGIVTAGGGAA
ncbi:MAG: cytochrome c biogenesis protein CcsA [Planctomycetota bacterium]